MKKYFRLNPRLLSNVHVLGPIEAFVELPEMQSYRLVLWEIKEEDEKDEKDKVIDEKENPEKDPDKESPENEKPEIEKPMNVESKKEEPGKEEPKKGESGKGEPEKAGKGEAGKAKSRDGEKDLKFRVINNDGTEANLEMLVSLKNVFAEQVR